MLRQEQHKSIKIDLTPEGCFRYIYTSPGGVFQITSALAYDSFQEAEFEAISCMLQIEKDINEFKANCSS
jgi:hypothetical protein